jgi:type III secretion protein V
MKLGVLMTLDPLLDALGIFHLVASSLLFSGLLLTRRFDRLFPTLLIIAAFVRLALSFVTSGALPHALGRAFTSSDLAVGVVMFAVVTTVQLLVVAKGAQRISLAVSRARTRTPLRAAMRITCADAIARAAISAASLLAGDSVLAVIGAHLMLEIAAILLTVAAGVLVMRIERARPSAERSGWWAASLAASLFGLVPDLPALPFLLLAAILLMVNLSAEFFCAPARDDREPAVILELDPVLSRTLSIAKLRRALELEMGLRFPPLQVASGASNLPPYSFALRIDGVPLVLERAPIDRRLVLAHPEEMARLGVVAERTKSPLRGEVASIIAVESEPLVRAAGHPTFDAAGAIALTIAASLRTRISRAIGIGDHLRLPPPPAGLRSDTESDDLPDTANRKLSCNAWPVACSPLERAHQPRSTRTRHLRRRSVPSRQISAAPAPSSPGVARRRARA